MKKHFKALIALALIFVATAAVFVYSRHWFEKKTDAAPVAASPVELVKYSGTIYHIFFHSLVLYPELAFKNNPKAEMFREYMVTQREFKNILDALYKDNFVLIDIASIYKVDESGNVTPKELYVPKGKKPLIISLDDLSYYSYMQGRGFANKLVIDAQGNVATQVLTPDGKLTVTRDGDVVPLLDDFVAAHPDFSVNGAKGVIALTGFEGVLGYRTQNQNAVEYTSEVIQAKKVIERLKDTGWRFASHSYSHDQQFLNNTISLEGVKRDTERWEREVGSLVGPTDIFIGPFGQVFQPHDPRRQYLVSQGFKMLCGVGMDLYLNYFPDYVMMDRADIDGYRLITSPYLLHPYFKPELVMEELN